MRRLRKKGTWTSVITDVFAVFAYFIIFIIVLFFISDSDLRSKKTVSTEELKVDLNMELLDGLRTPIDSEVPDARGFPIHVTMSFAEYIAQFADCNPEDKPSIATADWVQSQEHDLEYVLGQMEPFFSYLKGSSTCFRLESPNAGQCSWLKPLTDSISRKVEEKSGGCPNFAAGLAGASSMQQASVKFPSRQKNIITAMLWSAGLPSSQASAPAAGP